MNGPVDEGTFSKIHVLGLQDVADSNKSLNEDSQITTVGSVAEAIVDVLRAAFSLKWVQHDVFQDVESFVSFPTDHTG